MDKKYGYKPVEGDTKKGSYMGGRVVHSKPKKRQDGVNQTGRTKADDYRWDHQDSEQEGENFDA